jgi:hypothetical protein
MHSRGSIPEPGQPLCLRSHKLRSVRADRFGNHRAMRASSHIVAVRSSTDLGQFQPALDPIEPRLVPDENHVNIGCILLHSH